MRLRLGLAMAAALAAAAPSPGADDFVGDAGGDRRPVLAVAVFAANPLRPPAVKASDAEVIAFVANSQGAVGYVSKAAVLSPEVKAIAVVE